MVGFCQNDGISTATAVNVVVIVAVVVVRVCFVDAHSAADMWNPALCAWDARVCACMPAGI